MKSKIVSYIKKNWGTLPHSHFNNDEVVIFQENYNSNEGYGNHSYAGFGVSKDGGVYYCYSSGCSCSGSCGTNHKKDAKVLLVEDGLDLSKFDPVSIDFAALEVGFSDYE